MKKALNASLSPVFVDGILYVSIAVFAFMQIYLSNDDAYKYVSAVFLFWAKYVIGTLAAAAGALKMFRSTTYSDHVNKTTKPVPPNPSLQSTP